MKILVLFSLFFFSTFVVSGEKTWEQSNVGRRFQLVSKQVRNLIEASKQINSLKSSSLLKTKTTTTRKLSPLERLKMTVRRRFNRKIDICYERFQRCSEQFSPTFCASSPQSIPFYIWARNIAKEIMNGSDDTSSTTSNVSCSPEVVRRMALLVNSKVRNRELFSLWMNSGRQ